MAAHPANGTPHRWRALRLLPWIAAAILLLLPAAAMQLHVEGVDWSGADFLVMGVMLLIACGAFELAARHAPDFAYLAAGGVAIGTGFLLAWANLAVGIVGEGFNRGANPMFFGVLLVAIVGAAFARLRAAAMARAMLATAFALALAITAGLVVFGATAREAGLALGFVAGWLAAAGLFSLSARGRGALASP